MGPSTVEAGKEFFYEILDTLKAFARECVSPWGRILLGYTLIICTHHVVLKDPRLVHVLEPFLPYAREGLIRKCFLDVVFFGFIAAALIVLVHRHRPLKDFGLAWPAKKWVALTGFIFGIQLFGILVASQIPSLREFYPMFRPARQGGSIFWWFQAIAFLSMVSWEFINRGYLLFGLKDRLGLGAVLVGAVPFAILHFGKPDLELYWSIFDGIGLALLAYASGSIWPAVFLHGVGAFLLDVTLVYILPPP